MNIDLVWDYDPTLLIGTPPEVEKFEVWTYDPTLNTRVEKLGETSVIPADASPFRVQISVHKTIQGTAALSVWAVSADSAGIPVYSASPASMSVAVLPKNVTGLRQL